MKQLILGGVRSGKSRLAERLAADSGLEVVVIATALALDAGMQQRIAQHQASRPPQFQLIEQPLYLADCLQQHARSDRLLLVDCLTLWLTQLLCAAERDQLLEPQLQRLLDCVPKLPGQQIFIGNETGLGIMPIDALSREFGDKAGWLHQQLAGHCDRVILTLAGLPLVFKGHSL